MFVNEGVPGKPEYLSLSEGQRQGSLEVMAGGINLKDGAVRVKISGEERTLSFSKDGLKPAVGSPLMPAPGGVVPRFVGGFNPAPSTPGGTMVPPPNFQVPQPNPQATGVPAAVQPAGTAIPAPLNMQTTPNRPMRAVPINTTQQQQSQPPPAPVVDPVVQAVQIEVNRAVNKAAVASGQLPPLPPTDLTGR